MSQEEAQTEKKLEKYLNFLVKSIKELEQIFDELKNDKGLQNKKQVLNGVYTKIQNLKTIANKSFEESSEIQNYILKLEQTLEKLWSLAEPPYFPAIFKQLSEAQDPRKEIMAKRKPPMVLIKCWLIPINGQDTVGTIDEKLSKKVNPGEFVLINKEYGVVSAIPSNETDKFVTLNEGTVTGILNDLIMVKDSSGTTVKSTILSLDLKKELAEKPLDEGDSVLLFGNIIVKILERLKLTTTKEDFRKANFTNIGGLDEQIQEIKHLLGIGFNKFSLAAMKGKKKPKGIILFGPPGNGKTLIARALTTEFNWHLEVINGPEIEDKFVGETPRKMREAFANAKKHKPSILYIDEADSIFPTRGISVSRDYTSTYVAQFNVLMDGIEDIEGVFVILSTNRMDQIDPAIIRPGRLDKKIEIPPPRTRAQAETIIKIYLKNQPIAEITDNLKKTETINKWAELISSDIFDSDKHDPRLFTAIFENSQRDFYFKDFISGAIIENMIDTLETKALVRMENENIFAGDPKFGIIEEDLNDLSNKTIISSIPKEERIMINWMLDHGYNAPQAIRYNENYFKD